MGKDYDGIDDLADRVYEMALSAAEELIDSKHHIIPLSINTLGTHPEVLWIDPTLFDGHVVDLYELMDDGLHLEEREEELEEFVRDSVFSIINREHPNSISI